LKVEYNGKWEKFNNNIKSSRDFFNALDSRIDEDFNHYIANFDFL
jgi:hypothetical protein